MKRLALAGLPLCFVLLLAGPVVAQPSGVTNRATGLAPPAGELGTEQLLETLRALETLTTEVEWETRGASRQQLNASRIRMTATWERPRSGGDPVLVSAVIQPVAGGRLHFGDEQLNKITIDRDGRIHLDRKGINITVSKVTRKRNGDMEFHLPWWAFGNKTVKKDDLPFELTGWPPTLDELARGLATSKSGDTAHEGLFRWNVTGVARPTPLPFPGGALTAGSRFGLRGAGELRPDGSFRTIGDGNQVTVDLTVGDTAYRRDNRVLEGRIRNSTARFNGNYAVSVPAGSRPFVIDVDGGLTYSIQGENVRLTAPSGARVHAAGMRLSGDGRLTGSLRPDGGSMVLRDGTYRLDLAGPLGVSGLTESALTLGDLELDGRVTSRGRVHELSMNRLALSGSAEAEVTARNRGAVGVLVGDEAFAGTIERGSTLALDLPDVALDIPLDDRPTTGHARGDVRGSLDLGDASYRGDAVTASAERARVDLDLAVAAGRSPGAGVWIEDAQGRVGVRLDQGGRVTHREAPDLDWSDAPDAGLPGGPVLAERPQPTPSPRASTNPTPAPAPAPAAPPAAPAAPRVRTHEVVRGDTLSALARRYGVSLAALRAANGIAPSSDLIRVGERLTVPGDPAPAPRPAPAPAPQPTPAPPAPVATPPAAPEVVDATAEAAARRAAASAAAAERSPGWTTEVAPGAEVELELERARLGPEGLVVEGVASAQLRVSGLELRAGLLEARILGAAEASLARTAFRLEVGPDGRHRIQSAPVRVPVRIQLDRGSRVVQHLPVNDMDITFDRDGSYAEFTAVVRPGPDGRLTLGSLEEVDLLVYSDGVGRFAGSTADIPGAKTIRYTGRMVLLDRGLDFYGDVTVSVRGSENEPAVRIRW